MAWDEASKVHRGEIVRGLVHPVVEFGLCSISKVYVSQIVCEMHIIYLAADLKG